MIKKIICRLQSILGQNGKIHCLAKFNAPERAERAYNEPRRGVCRYQWSPRRTGLDGAHGPPVLPLLHIHLWSGPPRHTPSTPPALYRQAHLVLLLHTFGMMLSNFVLYQLSFCTTHWRILNFNTEVLSIFFLILNFSLLTRESYCFFINRRIFIWRKTVSIAVHYYF